jgi:predicted permease
MRANIVKPMTRFWQRLKDLIAWQSRDQDIHDEMGFHLESLTRDYIQAGMPEAEARLASRRQFGSLAKLKDQGHDERGSRLEPIVRDLRHATRRLVRTPGFTLAAVATLALAIGANAAIFTVVYRVVLNPLPYRDSGRLIELDHGASVINVPSGMGMKRGLYHYYADRLRTLEGLAIYTTENATLTGDEGPERLRISRTTTSLAPLLGVTPLVGRWFTADEGTPGARPVGLLSHRLWTRRYDGDAGIVGRALTIDGVPTDIVGVMPPDFAFPESGVDLWLPERISRAEGLGIWTHRGVARLRDGVTIADARAEIDDLIAGLPQAFPDDPLLGATGVGWGVRSTAGSLQEATIGDIAATLWLLLAAVGLVLLVAAANVANLFLVRAEGRQREVAVRRALGAGGGALARLFLTESVLLSIAAAALGLVLASGAVGVLVSTAPFNLPRLEEVRLDGVVVAFVLLLSVATALAFGSMPLVGVARTAAAALHEAGRRSTASRSRHRARHLLMGAQVALALVLVTSAGLMVRSVGNLRAIDPGFNATSALTFVIALPERGYPDRERAVATHQSILGRLEALPGVTAASAATCLPLSGTCFGNGVIVEGQVFAEEQDADSSSFQGTVAYRAVAGEFFETMGIALLRGRTIDRGDVDRREPVAVVDEAFADLILPNEDPIGQRVSWSLPPARPGEAPRWTWLEIVGVVPSTPMRALGEPDRTPQLYMPVSMTGRFGAPSWEYIGPTAASMAYVVRAPTLSAGLLPSIRRAVDEVDPNLPVALVSTLEERLDRAAAPMAFTMTLITIAAIVGLLLGLVGIYAVIAYVVRQRTGEIGVRLALGAEPGGIAGLITRQGAVVTLAGVAIGLAVALLGGRLLESILFGVGSRDPVVLAVATLATVALALLACWLPARRAAAVSPVEALRVE